MSDEIDLLEKVREAMRTGRLPRRRPDRIWGGPSAGGHCAVCRRALRSGELELEIEFASEELRPPHSHQVHQRCFALLETEMMLEIERKAILESAEIPGASEDIRG